MVSNKNIKTAAMDGCCTITVNHAATVRQNGKQGSEKCAGFIIICSSLMLNMHIHNTKYENTMFS